MKTNRIYFGDNLPILQDLPSDSVDLIYIDPPFNTGKIQSHTKIKTIRSENGTRKGFQGNTYETVELGTKAYKDSFEFLPNEGIGLDINASYEAIMPEASLYYLEVFLKPRLLQAYRLLKPHGSLYFHIDYRESHYCRILLDRIFGRECFLNEIIWAYDYGGRPRSKWPAKHDTILFYVKDPKKYIFNASEIDREPYMAPGLVGPEKAKKGKLPTDVWWPRHVGWWSAYSGFNKGGATDAQWQTIVPTGSSERVGYPTQKPRKLIDRIIKASSFPGTTVLDFFAGSGTVGESCYELNRNFILIDNNQAALEVMAARFSGAKGIEWVNFDASPFQLRKRKGIAEKNNTNNIPMIAPEFLNLAATASYIQEQLEENSDLWKNSPFEWVLQLPARSKGKLGRQLLSPWLESKGIQVTTTGDSSETLSIKGFHFATKFSTMWTKGFYRFQQIRSTGYDYVICLGISPFEAHCWIFERSYVLANATMQHRGAKEYWIYINPADPPTWAEGHGGSLDEAFEIIRVLEPKALKRRGQDGKS